MNKLKRILLLLASAIMIFSLVACGNNTITKDDEVVKEDEIIEPTVFNENDGYISIVDLMNVTFKVPRDMYNTIIRSPDIEELDNDDYYLESWNNYIEIIKGDFSEAFMIEVNENFDESEFSDLTLESVQKTLEEDTISGIELKEIVFKEDKKVIFSADISAEILAQPDKGTFEGNGYVVVITEDERELLAVFISENTDDSNNKKLFKIAKSVEFVDYDKYKMGKKDSHKSEAFTNLKIAENFEIEVPKSFHDYRVNAYGFLFAAEKELISNDENMVYWMSDEYLDYFVLALSDMSANILVDTLDYNFHTIDEVKVSDIEELVASDMLVSNFEGEKIVDDSDKKIFKVSLDMEEEGLFDEIIKLNLNGYVGIYEIKDSMIYVMVLSDSLEDDWKLRVVESLKEFE